MKIAAIAGCALLLAVTTTQAQQTPAPRPVAGLPLTLPELEELALQKNPTMQQAQAAIDAARGRGREAAAWPNPVIGYSAEEITRNGTDPRGEHGFFVEQTIPLGGKMRLGREVFTRAAERAEAELEQQRRRIVSGVRTLFYEAMTIQRRVEVQERLAALASEAVGITAQLYNVGAADKPDFLEMEIEAHRMRLSLNAAKNRAFALRQQLAAVAGDPGVASRPLSGSLDAPIPELQREAAISAVVDQNPQLRAARAEVARTEALTAQARKTTFPDLFLRGGAAYNRERGDRSGRAIGWEGQIEAGVSVPLFNRNQGGIAAARAEETRARADLQRLELSLRSAAAMEFAEYLTAVGEVETYRREILPRAEEAYKLYLARYREMAAAYPQVLVAQRTLFEMSDRYLESVEGAWRAALRIQGLLAGEGLQAPGGGEGASR